MSEKTYILKWPDWTSAELREQFPEIYARAFNQCVVNRALLGDDFKTDDKICFDLPVRMSLHQAAAYNAGWCDGRNAGAESFKLCWGALPAQDRFKAFHVIWSRAKGDLRWRTRTLQDAAQLIDEYKTQIETTERVHVNDALSYFAKVEAIKEFKNAFGKSWQL